MMHGQNNSRARIAAQAWIRQPLQLTNLTIRLVIRGSALTYILTSANPCLVDKSRVFFRAILILNAAKLIRPITSCSNGKSVNCKPVENHGNPSFHLLSSLHLAFLFHSHLHQRLLRDSCGCCIDNIVPKQILTSDGHHNCTTGHEG